MLDAVEKFQSSHKLTVDGVIGKVTQKKIEDELDILESKKIWYRVRRSPNDAKTQLIATRDKDAALAHAKSVSAYVLEDLKVIYTPSKVNKPKVVKKAPVAKPTPVKAKPVVKPTPPPAKATIPYPGLLKEGSKGKDVERVQRAIGISVDGSFGPNTKKAVIAYQKRKGLIADGYVGPATWNTLF
jgi:peptidoglycan hydrolase-like protein with peptidoglycan-binding domain